MIKNILTLILGFVLIGCASIDNEDRHTIYAVYDKSKVGEMAMINALVNEIASNYPEINVIEKPNAKIQDLDLNKPCSIITAGQFGISLAKSEVPQHVKVLLCVHQWFDSMKSLHNIYITMPQHTIDEKIQHIAQQNHLTLLPTLGVLHTMSFEALEKEDASAVRLNDAKVGVILAGDAELPNGGWKTFSTRNAKKLAEEIAEFQKRTGYKLLITNGPRTGRAPNAHKNSKLDFVSNAFLRVLKDKGLEKDKDFEFFDFQFGQPSALKAVIKIIQANKGFMIVPGESTSSISEILSVLPAAIYNNDAMNAMHKVFVDQLVQANLTTSWPQTPDAITYPALPPQEVDVVKKFLQ
ncbi:MAG: hypothetical protein ACK4V2_07480 [Pseudomonadota bacterium]|jgi:hypothetical protein|nr:hypothetical protein [Alphaproteobacteria bacterium]